MAERKITDEIREAIIKEYLAGMTQVQLAAKHNVHQNTIGKVIRQSGVKRPTKDNSPAQALRAFRRAANSILYSRDGPEKATYKSYKARIAELSKQYTPQQAVVQAAKEYPALEPLFQEYDVSHYDPCPATPGGQSFSQSAPQAQVECEDRDQTLREDLHWAATALGRQQGTGETPRTCPNWRAYGLYRTALTDPGKFLPQLRQAEQRGGDESEEERLTRKAGKRSVEEIERMLRVFSEEENEDETFQRCGN